jgi:hypothetical protein
VSCKNCGSYSINLHLHGRGTDNTDLCDVCYWIDKAENANTRLERGEHLISKFLGFVDQAKWAGYDISAMQNLQEDMRKFIRIARNTTSNCEAFGGG